MHLMVWNIQNFNKNKLDDSKDPNLSAARLGHVLNTIQAVQPDILVVLEVGSSMGVLGSLASGGGVTASLQLLEVLRSYNGAWRLVPPLKLVGVNRVKKARGGGIELDEKRQYTEAISVYFDSTLLDFVGPYVWPADVPEGPNKVAVPYDIDRTNGGGGPYPGAFAQMLTPGDFYAGQYQFFEEGHELLFVGRTNRRPFLCRFQENVGEGRLITVVVSHPSPKVEPEASTHRLLGWMYRELPVGPREVQVLPGDFNIDVIASSELKFDARRYGFTLNFTAASGPTMLQPVPEASPESYFDLKALDNIITRYGSDLAPPDQTKAYVVNRVAGVPGVINPDMKVRLGAYIKYDDPDVVFRLPENYGKIAHRHGVSDHMALMIEL